MKKCEKFTELISGYIDSELSLNEIKQLKNHLVLCKDCGKRVEMFKGLKTTLKEKIVLSPSPVSLRRKITENMAECPLPVKSPLSNVSLWQRAFRRQWFLFPRWAYTLVSVVIILTSIMIYRQQIIPRHFLVLGDTINRVPNKIQEHINDCLDCQKKAVKLIKKHTELVSPDRKQLQKHLDDCSGCSQKIIKMVGNCMESMV